VSQLCGGENRVKGWTGMVHLPKGDVREARHRAKFPRWGNWECFRNHHLGHSEVIHYGFRNATNNDKYKFDKSFGLWYKIFSRYPV